MPGMPYLQHVVSLERGSSPLRDLFSFDTDSSLGIPVIDPFQFRTGVQAPLVPSRHKACKPSQGQVEWILRAQEELQVKHSSRNCTIGFNASNEENGEGENDLADMVHDFLENGSFGQHEVDASDSDTGATAVFPKLCDGLQQVLTAAVLPVERDIASTVASVIIGANELDLFCPNDSIDCGGSCIRRLAVKRLRMSGYDASVCKSKWLNTGKVPGGEYEYIDVSGDEEQQVQNEDIIIDIDFRSQFEIARPSPHYVTALKSLPVIFVGKSGSLEQILQIMSEAAKCSLKQNSMHLPPWRTLDYMRAKWLSPHERRRVVDTINYQFQLFQAVNWRDYYDVAGSSQCREHLRRLKGALKAEAEEELVLKPISNSGPNVRRRRGTC
eukprot:c24155_g1_i1 orf=37-1188(-)